MIVTSLPGLVIEKVYVGYWFWGPSSNDQLWPDIGKVLARINSDFDPTTREARAKCKAAQAPAAAA